jgi:DNA-binding GntR family transcriptional regulator
MPVSAQRTNLNDQVYETLKTRLVRRELGPGAKVSLHELAATLGVSRSPVHHALTRLVAEGLLSVKSRRGYFVTPLTEAAIAEGYDVRLALELQAAETAVGRVGRDDLRRFRELHRATAAAVSHAEWDCANAAFHEHQVDLAGNTLLSRFYRDLSVNLMMQVIRGGKLEGGSYLPTEHAAIVDAYEADDLGAAHAAIRAHIATGRRIALDAIEGTGGLL